MANKIRYGLKNVYYAIATIAADGSAAYTAPVALPGAVSLSLDPEGGSSNFYADNKVYYVTNANNGFTGSLELALIPESFYTDVLGAVKDSKDVLFEVADAATVNFALLFQFEGDDSATKHVIYNCVAGRPQVSGNTKEDTIEPQTQTIDLTATSIYNDDLKKDITRAWADGDSDSTVYNAWFTTVQQYTGA